MPHVPAGVDAEDLGAGYERSDMRPAVVIAAALGLLAVLVAVLFFVTVLESALTGVPGSISRPQDLIGGLAAAPQPTPPAPALEAQTRSEPATVPGRATAEAEFVPLGGPQHGGRRDADRPRDGRARGAGLASSSGATRRYARCRDVITLRRELGPCGPGLSMMRSIVIATMAAVYLVLITPAVSGMAEELSPDAG